MRNYETPTTDFASRWPREARSKTLLTNSIWQPFVVRHPIPSSRRLLNTATRIQTPSSDSRMFVGRCSILTSFCSSIKSLSEKGSDPLRRYSKRNQYRLASKGSDPFSDRLSIPAFHRTSNRFMRQIYFPVMIVFCLLSGLSPGDDAVVVSYRRDIAPILLDNCFACHGPKKAEGGYRVDTYDELLKAGDSGESPIASSPEQSSELLRRIACEDEFERMPPESEPLTTKQIALFKQWIDAGGNFDGEDASQSLQLVIPPPQYADPPKA